MAAKSFRFPQIFSWVDFQQSMPPRIQSILPTFKERRLFGLLGFKPAGALETDSSILVRCFFNTGYMNLLLLEKNPSRNNMETPNKKIREKRRKNTGNFPRWFFPPVLLSPPDQQPRSIRSTSRVPSAPIWRSWRRKPLSLATAMTQRLLENTGNDKK